LIKYIVILFITLLVLFFSIDPYLKIVDKWKKSVAENMNAQKIILGFLIPCLYIVIFIIPAVVVPHYFYKFLKLNISIYWNLVPLGIYIVYCLIFKSEEVGKTYSKKK
jgi:hypothetical protein